ncbi:DUF6783 domain-containing protein, partial [Blautia acetigignens]|uniref:DUF6783 domain-containing protein n=1 Tax=Blautia acetigignens TaxID=2981783 RepID=UPI003D7288C3
MPASGYKQAYPHPGTVCNVVRFNISIVHNVIPSFVWPRACLKNHSRNLHAPLCGRFCPNSVA